MRLHDARFSPVASVTEGEPALSVMSSLLPDGLTIWRGINKISSDGGKSQIFMDSFYLAISPCPRLFGLL